MKTLTARKFRLSFQELTEQVSVTLNRDGELVTLGTWTPISHPAATEAAIADMGRALSRNPIRSASQKDRDSLLRKINRTGSET